MRSQPPPLLVLLASAGVLWLVWTLARDIHRMLRTGVSRACCGPTVRRKKSPGWFRVRVIANVVLLLIFVAIGVAGAVAALRGL